MVAALEFAVPTGEYLQEWLDEHDADQAELARHLGVPRKHVNELISGKVPLSHAVARDLEAMTGVPSRIWHQYETAYRDALARVQADQEHAE